MAPASRTSGAARLADRFSRSMKAITPDFTKAIMGAGMNRVISRLRVTRFSIREVHQELPHPCVRKLLVAALLVFGVGCFGAGGRSGNGYTGRMPNLLPSFLTSGSDRHAQCPPMRGMPQSFASFC